MGRLKDFIKYLDDRHATVAEIEKRLCRLQEKYETFFQEVSRVREAELVQLTEHTLADRSVLPEWFNQQLDAVEQQVERELEERLIGLEQRRDELGQKAEEVRLRSREAEAKVHQKNVVLDRNEEELKERNEKLLARISSYNQQIRELGRDFGFFSNFFKMRKLSAERTQLTTEQEDLAARIEALRLQWQRADEQHSTAESDLQQKWIDLRTERDAVAAKIDALAGAWPRIVLRTTLERVLDEQERTLPEPTIKDPECSRCGSHNPGVNHFCCICAKRLGADRPDFDGSLEEIAEINTHFQRFSDGMRACQELIGLVRGIKSGIAAFSKSVEDVRDSEKKYPLPKLQIDVPASSVTFGTNFDRLKESLVDKMSLHPQHFARQAGELVATVLTENNIKSYFETMGDELSRQADSQW
jgi:predicted  nucleic acid-binding Zn-ribbon protein